MYVKAKYKICRRLGEGVFAQCQTTKFALSEQKKKVKKFTGRRPRARSEYGKQLIEKQKIRYTYGLSERQLRNYVAMAEKKTTSNVGDKVFSAIESRLDNTVFRLGLIHTRPFARQVVSHGHILVNGRKVTIPSYQMRVGDVISIRPGSSGSGLFTEIALRLKTHKAPSWLKLNQKQLKGEVVAAPVVGEVESNLNFTSLLEFYSR